MKLLKNEGGQALVLMAVAFGLLLTVAFLGAQAGLLFTDKRNVQAAADAAAIAAASEINQADRNAAAKSAAVLNGTDSSATIAVNSPPANGPNAGKAGYVEVIVTQPKNVLYSKIFGSAAKWNIVARAVAARLSPNPNGCGICALNPAGPGITLSWGTNFNGTVVGKVASNSTAPNSIWTNDYGQGDFNVTSQLGITTAGGVTGAMDPNSTPVQTGAPPVTDPLAGLATPSCSGGAVTLPTVGGYYTGTSLTAGCYTGLSTWGAGNFNFGPGVYYFNGDVSLGGSYNFTGTGITIYMNSGTFSFNGSSSNNLSAPTSGTYNGILFFQNPADINPITFTGSVAAGEPASPGLQGIIYAPTAPVNFTGAADPFDLTISLIAGSVNFDGSFSGVNIGNYGNSNAGNPLAMPSLVE